MKLKEVLPGVFILIFSLCAVFSFVSGKSSAKPRLEITNPKSVPAVGGEWRIHFNTRGSGELRIESADFTGAVRLIRVSYLSGERWTKVPVRWENNAAVLKWPHPHGEILLMPVKSGKHKVALRFGGETAYAENTTLYYRKIMNFASTTTQAVEDTAGGATDVTDAGPSGGCAGGNRKHRVQNAGGWRIWSEVTRDDFDDTDAPGYSACDYKGVWVGFYAADATNSGGTSVDISGGGTAQSALITARENSENSYGYAFLKSPEFDLDSYVTRTLPSFTFTDVNLYYDFNFRSTIGGSGSASDYDDAKDHVFIYTYLWPSDMTAGQLYYEGFDIAAGLNPSESWGRPLVNPRASGTHSAGTDANGSGSNENCTDTTRFCFDWGGGAAWGGGPSDNYGMRWIGQINLPSTANYTFCTKADDGSRVSIDGRVMPVFDWDTGTTNEECAGSTVNLSSGWHDIIIEMFEGGGDADIYVTWQNDAGLAKERMPWTAFRGSTLYKLDGDQWGGPSTDSYPYGYDYNVMWDVDAAGGYGSNPNTYQDNMNIQRYCTNSGFTSACTGGELEAFFNTIGTTSGAYRLLFYVPVHLDSGGTEKFELRLDDVRMLLDYSYDEPVPTVTAPTASPNPFSPQVSSGLKDTTTISSTVSDPSGGKSNNNVKGHRVHIKNISEEPVRKHSSTGATISQDWDGQGELSASGDYNTDGSGYIRNWLIAGPYSLTGTYSPSIGADYHGCDDDGACTDYLGGWESMIRPSSGLVSNGQTWGLHNDADCDIDLDGKYGDQSNKVAYAFAYVYSSSTQTVHVRSSSDDGVAVILNGTEIFNNLRTGAARGRGDCTTAPPDLDITSATLEKGWNDLLVKIDEGGGGWGFSARITNTSGTALSLPVRTTNPPQNALTNASEGKYRVYALGFDSVNQKSTANPQTADNKTCDSETITTGSSSSGTHSSTHDNGANTRIIDEVVVTGQIEQPDLSQSFDANTVGSTEGTHSNTQSDDATGCSSGNMSPSSARHMVWESCSFSCCEFDFDYHFRTTIPRNRIHKIEYISEFGVDDDVMRFWLWNYGSSAWSAPFSDTSTNYCTTQTYVICDEDAAVRAPCDDWVQASDGDIQVGWTDRDQGCAEDSDFFNIDYQYVKITYEGYQGEIRYVYSFSETSKSNVDSVSFTTDAWSSEAFEIWKYNYTSSTWSNTGTTIGTTETSRNVTICANNAECQDYINASNEIQMRYKDPQPKDNTNSPLNIDFQKMAVTYGGSFVEVKLDRTEPTTSLTAFSPDPYNSRTPSYTGSASDPLAGYSGGEVNSYIDQIEVNTSQTSCGSGTWTTSGCTADDGAFDSTTENYTCALSLSADGTWYVGTRAREAAGNTDTTPACDTVVIDSVAPTLTYNSPAAGSWQKANFSVSITDSDASPSSGISTCRFKVESWNGSSWVQTRPGSGWENFASCNTTRSVTLSVGAGNDCRNEGDSACKITSEIVDAANNTTSSYRVFSIDWTAPVTPAFNSPAASSWQKADFSANVSDSDATSGLASCEFMVESNNGSWTTTQSWTSRTCNAAASAAVTVGAAAFCRDQGTDLCRVTLRSTDNAGNVSSTAQRLFSIDWTAPSFTLRGWDSCATTEYTNNESYSDSTPCFNYPATDSVSGLPASPYTYVWGTDCSASPGTSTSASTYSPAGLSNATKYCFRVKAVDVATNETSVSTFTYIYNTETPSWRYPGAGSQVGPFYGGGTIRAYGAEQRLYIASNGGVMYAINAADGAEKWQCELDLSPDNGSITNCGASDYGPVVGSPLVFSGKIYLGTYYGYVLKFTDTGSGWTLDAQRDLGSCSIQSAALAITVSGATKILAGCAGSLYALNDDATFTNWSNWSTNPVTLTGSVTRSIPAFVSLSGGTDPWLYVATENGTLTDTNYGRVYKIDVDNGSIQTTFNDSADFSGFLILRNYFGDGKQYLFAGGIKNPESSSRFYALDTTSMPSTCGAGCVTFTDGGAATGFEGGASASSGGGAVYVGNNNGKLYRLSFNGSTLTKSYEFNAGSAIKYGVTFRQQSGKLYFGTDGGVFFIVTDNGASFTENLRYHTGDSVSATPAVNSTANKVVVPSIIGRLFSFAL